MTPQRRIDDRIYKLFTELQEAEEGDVETLLQLLLELIRQKNERLKTRAAKVLLKGKPLGLGRERRET